ncbi:MAG: hypothetical protein AB7O96_11005 [Pseudobdellovibrionaceae bacterium]
MKKSFTRHLMLMSSAMLFLGCLNPADNGIPFVGVDSENKLIDESIEHDAYANNLQKGIFIAQDSAMLALDAHDKRNPARKLHTLTVGFGINSQFMFSNVVTLGSSSRVKLVFGRKETKINDIALMNGVLK